MADDVDYTESDIWASPSQDAPLVARPKTPKTPKTPTNPQTPMDEAPQSETISRDDVLRKELEGVRAVNESIEGLLATINRAGDNMQVVARTVVNASSLLNTWTRILSQTEHNHRLLLHPGWKGVTEDLAEQEAEAIERQQAAERKAAEEERKREEMQRRRVDEENTRRLAPSSRGSRGSRASQSRGRTATVRASSSSRLRDAPSTSASRGRGTSGISRGTGTGTTRTRTRSRASR